MLSHTLSGGLVVYLSKYVYFGDVIKTADHTKYLGISNIVGILLVPVIGYLFDRYSARFLFPVVCLLSSGSFFGMYYYDSFTSPFAFALQICAKLFVGFLGLL